MRRIALLILTTLSLGLVACGERSQAEPARLKTSDAKASAGTQNGYAVGGWTQGDQTAWTNQLKARAQGQNEYTRSPAAPKAP